MPEILISLAEKLLPFIKKWAWIPCIIIIAMMAAAIIHHIGVVDGKKSEKAEEQKAIDLAKKNADQTQSEIDAVGNATASENTKVITRYVTIKDKESQVSGLNQPCGGADIISLLNQASGNSVSDRAR